MNRDVDFYGAYDVFSVPSFLSCLKRIFDLDEEYDIYNCQLVCKLIKERSGNDDKEILEILKSFKFWIEVEKFQLTQVFFENHTGSYEWIARRFLQHFFKFNDSRNHIHRRIMSSLNFSKSKIQHEIDVFINALIHSKKTFNSISTNSLSSKSSDYEDANSVIPDTISPNYSSDLSLNCSNKLAILPLSPIKSIDSNFVKSNIPFDKLTSIETNTLSKNKAHKKNITSLRNEEIELKITSLTPTKSLRLRNINPENVIHSPDKSRQSSIKNESSLKLQLSRIVNPNISDEDSDNFQVSGADKSFNQSKKKDLNNSTVIELIVDSDEDSQTEKIDVKEASLGVDDHDTETDNDDKNENEISDISKECETPKEVLENLSKEIEIRPSTFLNEMEISKISRRSESRMLSEGIDSEQEVESVIRSYFPGKRTHKDCSKTKNDSNNEESSSSGAEPKIKRKNINRNRINLEKKTNFKQSSFYFDDDDDDDGNDDPDNDLSDRRHIDLSEKFIERQPRLGVGRWEAYTEEEDRRILLYICRNDSFQQINGRLMWQEMAQHLKGIRTWQSLKERFMERLLPKIDSYCLINSFSEDITDRFNQLAIETFGNAGVYKSSYFSKPNTIVEKEKIKLGRRKNEEIDKIQEGKSKKRNEINENFEKKKISSSSSSSYFSDGDNDSDRKRKSKNITSVNDDFDISSVGSSIMSTGTRTRTLYSKQEDEAIMNFVFNVQLPLDDKLSIGGNSYWMSAAERLKNIYDCKRTWASLKERFKKVIVKNIHLYDEFNTTDHRKVADKCYLAFLKNDYKKYIKKYDFRRQNIHDLSKNNSFSE